MEKRKLGIRDKINCQLCKHPNAAFLGGAMGYIIGTCGDGAYHKLVGGEPLFMELASSPYLVDLGAKINELSGYSMNYSEVIGAFAVGIPAAVVGVVAAHAISEIIDPFLYEELKSSE